MPQRAQRMCSKCYAQALPGSPRCAAHAQREPNRKRNDLRPLYKCKRWRVTRMHVLARDVQCTHKENGKQCVQLSTDVHHVVEAEQWVAQGGDFYDQDNLAGLCHPHHSGITARTQGFAARK